MNIPDPINPKIKLFHMVNKMFICNGYIFQFHPSWSQQAREVVAGLLVFLTGLWCGTINTMKFHKFFTDRAIEWSKDTWWDANSLSLVTKCNQEI